jgi:acyl-CoA dehydrogenase
MSWDFSTDPEFEEKLEWIRKFVHDQVRPLEVIQADRHTIDKLMVPLQRQVKDAGLWAAHLPPELGGGGFGQLKLALIHEILGAELYGSQVFGNYAPDSGNAELIAVGGTEEQKQRWMVPLLDGRLKSAFSMTEPGAGSDPTLLTTRAHREGDSWVINGHKWFTSNGSTADFLIVMCVTDPEAEPRKRASMIIVPRDTPGVNILRNVWTMAEPDESLQHWGTGESEIRYENVRVPGENLIGREGEGFALAQSRLGPGRIHHCMRWIGQCHRAFDMMCERAVSRYTAGSLLSDKQLVQEWVADSAAEIHAARLMVLHTAWRIDTAGVRAARTEISMIKYFVANVLFRVVDRALQTYGSLGYSTDMPLELMFRQARAARIVDGPDEVHRVSVARRILREYQPAEVPTDHIPSRRPDAVAKFAHLLDEWPQ